MITTKEYEHLYNLFEKYERLYKKSKETFQKEQTTRLVEIKMLKEKITRLERTIRLLKANNESHNIDHELGLEHIEELEE